MLHRSAKPAQQGAIDHAQVTEVYHIIDGSGTFVTGGTIQNARPVPADNVIHTILVGPSTTGASAQSGQNRHAGPGDVIIVPPGVAHWFSKVDSDMNYLVVRVDGDHILPAGDSARLKPSRYVSLARLKPSRYVFTAGWGRV